jgi:hypothetical protein
VARKSMARRMAYLSSHGEGAPFGIESHDAEKPEGRAEQVGNIESRDGRSLAVRRCCQRWKPLHVPAMRPSLL